MQDQRTSLSTAQADRMERLAARFPATRFEIVAQDRHSCAISVEVEDLETSTVLTISATGRTREA